MLIHKMFESHAAIMAKAFPERGKSFLINLYMCGGVGEILCPRIFDSVFWEVPYLHLTAISKIGAVEYALGW